MQLLKLLTAIFLSLLINISYCAINSFTVGGVITVNDKTQPLILTGDGATTWSAWPNIDGLPDHFNGHVASSICHHQQCYMAGFSYQQNGASWPILLKTDKQHKNTWINTIEGLPQDMTAGLLRKISCSNNTCVAVGSYYSGNLHVPEALRSYFPLIVMSDNKGESWSAATISGLPANMNNITLNQVVCTQENCIAAGSITIYTPDKAPAYTSAPLFLLSYDQGQSWFYSAQTFNLPGISMSSFIEDMTCRAGVCLAVGSYYDLYVSNGYVPRPLLLLSQDNGNTWAVDKSLVGLLDNWVSLKAISCIDDVNCIATGAYKNIKEDWQTLILVSHDSGKTWALNKSETRPYVAVDNLSCTSSYCVTVGFSPDLGDMGFLVSNNAGDTWSVKKITQNHPSDYKIGHSKSLVCHGAECVLAGVYSGEHDNFPLLVESHDSGETWSFVTTINNLPSNINEGSLNTVSVSK